LIIRVRAPARTAKGTQPPSGLAPIKDHNDYQQQSSSTVPPSVELVSAGATIGSYSAKGKRKSATFRPRGGGAMIGSYFLVIQLAKAFSIEIG
jgi:hypothetical protein